MNTDAIFLAGVLVALVGIAWIWPPLGLIAAGAVLCGAALLLESYERHRHPPR
jgi:hypothetical protein